MNVNVRGTIDLIRQVLPHMARTAPTTPDNERGVIIMVASSAAFDGQPGQVAYAASKGAIRSLTLPLTRDLARHGIRVMGQMNPRVSASADLERLCRARYCPTPRAGLVVAARTKNAMQHSGHATARAHRPRMSAARYRLGSGDSDPSG